MFDKYNRDFIRSEVVFPKVKRGIPVGFSTRIFWFRCRACGKEFSIPLKRYNQGVGVTCSKKCMGDFHCGKNNPHYTNGKALDRVASSRRARIIKEVGKCENCGFDKLIDCLEVHHVVPRKVGGSSKRRNLQVLCSICHRYKTTHGVLPKLDLSDD